LLEGRATFPMVVLEDYLLPCDFWGFYLVVLI
jgi:hypothetical protein